jgi:uncharacterized membrane protein
MKKKILLTIPLLAIALQFVPAPAKTNPPVDPTRSFDTVMKPPPEVRDILRRACYDCHSDETKWPWYADVAPVSWPVRKHVVDGRRHLNFSQWLKAGETKYTAWSDFEEIGISVLDKSMPIPGYDLMHPEAKLTQAERELIAKWVDMAIGAPN